ncbi:hypothetical protein SBDP1_840022 [Syntrophobacter sp. SbD1]|nr:hypothetical protein SBDP1_840022 [Syntrophobacter sp. SbD1]
MHNPSGWRQTIPAVFRPPGADNESLERSGGQANKFRLDIRKILNSSGSIY